MKGRKRFFVEEGRTFDANKDQKTKKRIEFQETVYAKTIRIHPQTWPEFLGLRFSANFIDTSLL